MLRGFSSFDARIVEGNISLFSVFCELVCKPNSGITMERTCQPIVVEPDTWARAKPQQIVLVSSCLRGFSA